MSLVPRINFPINFYFWEGRSPSSKETKGRGKKGEGGGCSETGRQGCGPVLLFTSTGHQSLHACSNQRLDVWTPKIPRSKPTPSL